MVFTILLLKNALAIRPCNCGTASEPLLPKAASCIPILSSRYIGKCAARVLKRSSTNLPISPREGGIRAFNEISRIQPSLINFSLKTINLDNFMPGKPVSANLEGLIFKIFWGSMPPDPLKGLKNFSHRCAAQQNLLA